MQFPITIGLHRSRFLGRALFLLALLACGVTLALPWPTAVRAGSLMLVLIVAYFAWRRLEPELSAIRLEKTGQVLVAAAGSVEFADAELLAGATVHPWLTIIRLKTQDGRTHRMLAAVDTMKSEDFRRLRIFLRWRAEFSVPVGDA